MTEKRKTVGLALGAGSVRGFAHIGVLIALREAGIPIDYVAGSSVGSLIGAAIAAGMSIDEILELSNEFRWHRIIRPTWWSQGLGSFAPMETFINRFLDNPRFENLSIPLAVVATDVDRDEMVVITEGAVAPAVRGSCSVAGLVSPTPWEGRRLADGVYVNAVPVSVAREMGADYVVGVDVLKPSLRPNWGFISHLVNAFEIALRHSGGGTTSADCLITPDIGGFTYLRYSQRDELIELGKQAAEEKIPEIRQAVFGENADPKGLQDL
jgi:NTE family protein